MNRKVGLLLAVFCAFCQGYAPIAMSFRNIFVEPLEYSHRLDDHADMKYCNALAASFWEDFKSSNPEAGFSDSFATGFKDGFADYLFAGGAGNPPPVPPRWYWNAKYGSPEGHVIIEDWYAGFRQGGALAKSSDYRKWIIVPASTALPRRTLPASTSPAKDVLPLPKELPASELRGGQAVQPVHEVSGAAKQDADTGVKDNNSQVVEVMVSTGYSPVNKIAPNSSILSHYGMPATLVGAGAGDPQFLLGWPIAQLTISAVETGPGRPLPNSPPQ